jgi:2-oxo-4-hydroxy-4-carboxy-5-ureidoimidazoline decarboxylase
MSVANCLNRFDDKTLRGALAKCCASTAWIEGMARSRPFPDDDAAIMQAAENNWSVLTPDDWREAFTAHPKIGDIDSLRAKFAETRNWAGGEQAGVAAASEVTLERLAKLNQEYEQKFGYIFIICATGKSGDEMLAALEERLPNQSDDEIKIAAGEQLKITKLRLEKLVA